MRVPFLAVPITRNSGESNGKEHGQLHGNGDHIGGWGAGVSENQGSFLWGPHTKEHSVWGFILGSPYIGKVPCGSF